MTNEDSAQAGLAALDAFLDALNRRDEKDLNDALNFPHVRIASGKVAIFEKHGDYRLDAFLGRVEAEWAKSVWDERVVIHAGPDKVHFAVKFTRCAADGRRLASYRSIWIVTRVDGHWGVQARSSFAA